MKYPEREITEIQYSTYSESVYGADFEIDVTSEKVIKAYYFDEERTPQRKENYPFDAKLWEEVILSVDAIWDLYKEASYPKDKKGILDFLKKKQIIEVLDGGTKTHFSLRYTENGEKKYKEYIIPSDRRFSTTLELLKEIAYPLKRQIPHYSSPVIEGLRIYRGNYNEKNHFSFQCTLVNKEVSDEERYLFVYYREDNKEKSLSTKVMGDVWTEVMKKVTELKLAERKSLPYKSDTGCTLYISDNTQKTIEVDKYDIEDFSDLFIFLRENYLKK